MDKLREETRAKLDAAEASKEYLKAADFARNLVTETATEQEKAVMRLQELQRNYNELTSSGKPIPKEIEMAFARARDEALASINPMAKAFKAFAGKAEHFPDDEEARSLFDSYIKEVLE